MLREAVAIHTEDGGNQHVVDGFAQAGERLVALDFLEHRRFIAPFQAAERDHKVARYRGFDAIRSHIKELVQGRRATQFHLIAARILGVYGQRLEVERVLGIVDNPDGIQEFALPIDAISVAILDVPYRRCRTNLATRNRFAIEEARVEAIPSVRGRG